MSNAQESPLLDSMVADEEKGAASAFPEQPPLRRVGSKMSAVLWRRPQRLAIALALGVFTLLFVLWHTGWTDEWADQLENLRRPQYLDWTGTTPSSEQDIAAQEDAKPKYAEPGSSEEKRPEGNIFGIIPTVDPSIHRQQDANLFKGHMFNVTLMQGITMAEAKSTCQWEHPEHVNFQFGESSGWGVNLDWVKTDHREIQMKPHRDAMHNFLHNEMVEFDRYVEKFSGRGIVIVGGNGRSLKRVMVILKQLKKLGCTLPIELHYWGAELLEHNGNEIKKLWPNIHFNNLASPDNIFSTIHGGVVHYALKTAAMLNSRFAHMLMLDSDNIPVQDPETLFDSETYKEFGTIFWPDIARTRPNNPMWPITNTHCRMDEWEQESGQLVVNKLKFFYHLQLAHWFNSGSDESNYFRSIMLGDKDTFRFAWHMLRTKFGIPPKWVSSVGTLHTTSHGQFYCGHTFAQYHPNGKIAFLHGGLLKTMRKEVVLWEREKNGGVFQYIKHSEHPEDNSYNPRIDFKFDGQEYLPDSYKPEGGLEISTCIDFPDAKPQPFEEVLPGFNKRYEEIGGYWIQSDDGSGSILDNSL